MMDNPMVPEIDSRAVEWLSRSEEVFAHLFFAAAEIGRVQVDAGKKSFDAAIAFPHQGSQTIDILFEDSIRPPTRRGALRIRYHHNGSSFEFLTALLSVVDRRRWRLAVPNAVARFTNRGAMRIYTRHDVEYRILPGREDGEALPLKLHDLSTSGIAFAYPPMRLHLSVGDQILGTLEVPMGHRLPVLLEVRHTRPHDGRERIAGCELIGISPWARAMLEQSIAGLNTH